MNDQSKSTIIDKAKQAIVNHNHPIWRLLNVVVIAGFVLIYAAINAQNFDETELNMWLQFLLTLSGYEGVKALIGRNK